MRAAFALAEQYESKQFKIDALWFGTWINLELGELESAREYSCELLDSSIKEHYFLIESMGRMFNSRVLSRDGKGLEAIESAQTALDMFNTTGSVTGLTIWLVALAEAYSAAGMVEEGLEIIERTEQFELETGECRQKAELQMIKGDLYVMDGNLLAAEAAYLDSIAVAQQQSVKLLELKTVLKVARLWRQQGKGERARNTVATVYDWFTEGTDNPILIEARNLLGELETLAKTSTE